MTTNKKRKAYGYIRVSTDEQKKKGFSVTEQEEDLLHFAQAENIELIKIFVDDGYSAGNVNRPGFQDMLTEVCNNKSEAKIIITKDMSRLIRNIVLKKSIGKLLDKYHIRMIYLFNNIDVTTPEGAAASDIVGIMDERELKMVSPRTIKGLRGSALLGNYPYGSNPPKGYKRVPNIKAGKGSILKPDEDRKDMVIQIFETIATNRMSGSQMVKYLRKNKVFGLKWTRNELDSMIDNPIYYGRLVTNYFDSEEEIDMKYKQYWYSEECHTEPLISKELWLAAQQAYHHYKKQTVHKYLFSKMVYCTDTNSWMSNDCAWKKTKKGKKLYKYYTDKSSNKRINENIILERFALEYRLNKLDKINKEIRENLILLLKNKQKRRIILENDFDQGYIDEEDYIEQIREINLSIRETKQRIENMSIDHNENFLEMNYDKQKSIVLSNISKLNVSFIDNKIEFEYLS